MANRVAQDGFLADCEPYFLDGVHTIAQFAQRTQEIVREAVERHWSQLVNALGFSEDEVNLLDYYNPDKLQRVKPADVICLGVKLKVSNVFEAAIYRYWTIEEKHTGIEAYTWIKDRKKLDQLGKKMDDLPDAPPGPEDAWDFDQDNTGYYITRWLGKSEVGEIDARLDELISYYITLMTKAGGAKR